MTDITTAHNLRVRALDVLLAPAPALGSGDAGYLDCDDAAGITGFVHVMPHDGSPEPHAPAVVLDGGQDLVAMYLDPSERGAGLGRPSPGWSIRSWTRRARRTSC